jgi:hypothetical protein
MQALQNPRESSARCDPPAAQYADLETGGGAEVSIMPTARAFALRLGASERGEVRPPIHLGGFFLRLQLRVFGARDPVHPADGLVDLEPAEGAYWLSCQP